MDLIDMMQELVESLDVAEETKTYMADYEDDNFEVISAQTDIEAFNIAKSYEDEHGCLFNLFEVNDNYEEIREVKIEDVEQKMIEHLKKGGAINCTTEKQAAEFLELCDKCGATWTTGRSVITEPNNWKTYGARTCYRLGSNNKLIYASREYYRYEGKHIRRFKDFEQPYNDKSILDELNELANRLISLHALDCKRSNHHCIYSKKIYSESCLKCFALWLLKMIKKRE